MSSAASEYFVIDTELLSEEKFALIQAEVSQHWSVPLVYVIQVVFCICLMIYLAKGIYVWYHAQRKAKNTVIAVLVLAMVFTLVTTIGTLVPVFFLPLYTVLFHLGNILFLLVWHA